MIYVDYPIDADSIMSAPHVTKFIEFESDDANQNYYYYHPNDETPVVHSCTVVSPPLLHNSPLPMEQIDFPANFHDDVSLCGLENTFLDDLAGTK